MKTSIYFLILVLIVSCRKEPKMRLNEIPKSKSFIQFPKVSLDSTNLIEGNLYFYMTDSIPFLNPTISKQSVSLYTLQGKPQNSKFNNVIVKVKMPNRENTEIEYQFTNLEFKQLEQNFGQPEFKMFLRELLELNWKTRYNYYEGQSSLLDKVNMIFAHEIDSQFKEFFPENSTWFGFDSFPIFGMYFKECIEKTKGMGHVLIESIESSENRLAEKDKSELNRIIFKYSEIFKK